MIDRRPSLRDRLRGARRRIRGLVRRGASEREMARELAFHIEMETEHNIRRGMDPESARRTARIAFGGIDRASEDVRDVRNFGWLEDLSQDLRHAARAFRRTPGYTAAAVLALTLGVGANTAVFSVVHGILLAPLPYDDPDRLVRIWESNSAQRIKRANVSPGTLAELRSRSRALDGIALFSERDFLLSNGSETWESRAAAVSPELFDVLRVRPLVGRTFPLESADSSSRIPFDEVVISHRLWQQHFGGARDIVGRTMLMDARWTHTIVGVMPSGFSYPTGVDLWVPLVYSRTVTAAERQYRYYGALARVRPGLTLDHAARDAAGVAAQLASEFPASNAGWTVEMARLDRSIVGDTRSVLIVLLGLATCVLLIACGNVATLGVARANARRHEVAVRVALGAGTRRLFRQWTAEGLLLAALGGAGGVVVGYWSTRLVLAIAPADTPRLADITFGRPVLLFAVVVTVVTGVLIGLAPALWSRDTAPSDALRTRSPDGGSALTRAWLVGAQVALTFVLTVAATLLLRSFERLRATDLGFRHHDVLSADVRVPAGRFPGKRGWLDRVLYYDRLMAELARMPGVRSVAGTTIIPLTGELGSGSMWRTDAPGAHGRQPPTSAADQWKAAIQLVTPSYFETLGMPVLRGRAFDDNDRFTHELTDLELPRSPGIAVINEAMARRFWPDVDPLGRTIVVFDDLSFASYRTIVGVMSDVRAEAVGAPASPTVYLPFAQHPGRGLSLVLRTDVPPEQLAGAVADHLRAFDAAMNVSSVRPLAEIVGGALSRPRFTLLLVGSFAAMALVIAGVGIFGVVGFLVTRRTHEIGIRMALGARPETVLWLVLREGLRPVLLGVVVGSVGAVTVAFGMRALLYGLAPLDGVSFAAAAMVLLVASLVAAVRPARRAVGVDPLRSLRSE